MKQLIAALVMIVLPLTARAQQPQQPQQGQQPDAAPASVPVRTPPPPPANIRFEVTIRDEGGGGPATRRTVSVVVQANSSPGSVRSVGHLPATHPLAAAQAISTAATGPLAIPLNVDVRGSIITGTSRIPARVTVEYQPYWPEAKTLPSSVRAQVDAVLEDGRAMLISQAVDPVSDRRTLIEVTATVLK